MKRRIFIAASLFLLLASGPDIRAQSVAETKKPLIVSLFNAGTQLPGSGWAGVLTLPVHPGLCAGTEFRYNRSDKNQWFQTAKAGISWHRYVQTAVQLYSEGGYRRVFWRGTSAEFRLGAGYLHAIPAVEVFKLDDGNYREEKRWGRAQLMATTALGIGYTPPKMGKMPRFFLDYQFYLQLPFVKSYVPLLPNTALHVGAAFPILK